MELFKHAPCFDIEAATSVTEKLYGFRATPNTLPSERDQNFLLTSESGENFVLKIANALEDRALLQAQNDAMAHLGTKPRTGIAGGVADGVSPIVSIDLPGTAGTGIPGGKRTGTDATSREDGALQSGGFH